MLNVSPEDFALTEASYAIVQIIQSFPDLRIPPKTPIVTPGEERQALTIVVMSAEGCKVVMGKHRGTLPRL